jgi:hypothetical protein
MTDRAKSHSWWQTLPGVLTAIAGVITAVAGLLAALYQVGLFQTEKSKDTALTASSPISETKSLPRASPENTETTPNQIQTSSTVNLLAPENGGHVIVASGDDWLDTIDGKEGFHQIYYGLGEKNQAVYAFKDEKTAVIDMFTILISGTHDENVKEFELFAGNTSPTGPFESIGTFTTQNIKLYKTPYQEFRLPHVTAKYLKVKLLSTYGDLNHPILEEVQAFGRLVE